MSKLTRQSIVFTGGFFLFLIDRLLKFLAENIFTDQKIFLKIFGWNPYRNPGIAFNLPLPNWLSIALTVPILLIIIFLLIKFYQNQNFLYLFVGLSAIFWGALSNLIDRLFFHSTIDYWLLGTGLINLSDLLIISGFVIILLPTKLFRS
ncbi:MAG: signal peptidase II [Candidatus Magasanikbacteria bacterium]|nr:signal peptidase II [Candidatus Magasanikbacteria bacterium]